MGRLFDTVALVRFTREISFEGQTAMWLEHIAHGASDCGAYPFSFTGGELDWRTLTGVVRDRPAPEAFHA
ncbi:MAG: hypothetical protein ACR2JB_28000 [Bryobacteraceae bacterium]